ncbi:MAG: malectin domain-containing carbohydrate-binding protein [Trueperaceae bacterium]|nr:malectin domain-containing carbohydrate-binding protein [Trueperaceae bacterium]
MGETSLVITEESSDIEASTYNGGSFQITNVGDKNIASASLDLGTTVMPDMVYDPEGTAGDDTGKVFTADSGGSATGLVGGSLSVPHDGDPDDGYEVLTITFDDFEPGETFTFSVDNDPTSIKGATIGSQAAGPVSGLELTGATFTVQYADETAHTNQVFGDGSVGGSQSVANEGVPAAPTIDAQGVTIQATTFSSEHTAAAVTDSSPTIVVDAPAGENITLLQIEGELALDNVPDSDGTPGYDIEDFEANKAVNVIYHEATVGSGGTVDVPVTLTSSTDVGGYNYFVAAREDEDGATSLTSNVVVLQLVESLEPQALYRVNAGGKELKPHDPVWTKDTSLNPSTYVNVPESGNKTYSTADTIGLHESVPGGTPMALFQTERWDPSSDPDPEIEMTWSFDLASGVEYEVRLYLAEIYLDDKNHDAEGPRVFDVEVEGSVPAVFDSINLFESYGHDVGVMLSTTVTLADDYLDITFLHGQENPNVKGIEIVRVP